MWYFLILHNQHKAWEIRITGEVIGNNEVFIHCSNNVFYDISKMKFDFFLKLKLAHLFFSLRVSSCIEKTNVQQKEASVNKV